MLVRIRWSAVARRRFVLHVVTVFVSAFQASAQANEPLVGRRYAVGTPNMARAADLDGDGDVDVVSTDAAGSIRVLLNQGTGAFAAPVRYAVGDSPVGLALEDWEGDGDRDVFVCSYGSDEVTVLRNTGNGTLVGAGRFPAGDGPFAIETGDLDADGRLDLVVTSAIAGQLSVLRGTSATTFAAPVAHAISGPGSGHGLVVADLDGDALLDAVATSTNAMPIAFLRGLGNGSFAPAVFFGAGGNGLLGVCALDCDGDGDLDLAASNWASAGEVTLFLNAGSGSFSSASSIAVGAWPRRLASADLDGDFVPEIVVTCVELGGVYVLAQTAGVLELRAIVNTGGSGDCSLADFDRDGLLDLLTVQNAVAWFPGRGDGSFGSSSRWTSHPNAERVLARDFDGDGRVDLLSHSPSLVALSRNAGGGAFAAATPVYALANGLEAAAACDLDGDNDLDLALAGQLGPAVIVLQNDGSGQFVSSTPQLGNFLTSDVAAGDFDGDGDGDLLLARWMRVSYHANQGGLSFGPGVEYPIDATTLELLDVDGDGDLDVAAEGGGSFRILRNSGTGVFSVGPLTHSSGLAFLDFAAGDIDGDGDVDLAAVCFDIEAYLNTGAGVFSALGFLDDPNFAKSIEIADFDGDGVVDLVTGGHYGSISVRASLGNGAFAPPRHFAGAGSAHDLALGDFDGDSDLDVATLTAVMLGQRTEPPHSYCVGKRSSAGCTPSVGFSGAPSASSAASFVISAGSVLNQTPGIFFYAQHAHFVPFAGATLCVAPPTRRTPIQHSGGTSGAPADCSGSFAIDFNAHIQSGIDPMLVVGAEIFGQFWSRDPALPTPGISSNALNFRIRP